MAGLGGSARTREGKPEHFNGTVGITPITIDPSGSRTSQVMVYNPKTNDCDCLIQVSFDDGVKYFDVPRKATLSIEAEIKTFKIKANKAGCDYQILLTYFK